MSHVKSSRFGLPSRQLPDAEMAAPAVSGAFFVFSERDGSTHRIAPSGELDLATSERLEREIIRVEHTDALRIELDLAGLTFIDSVGIGVLIRAGARTRGDGRLQIKPGFRAVQATLVTAGADQSLPFVSPGALQLSRTPPEPQFVTDWSL